MKRSRTSVKNYIESSDSEDDRPLKKPSPSKRNEEKATEDSSSSESDIERYLHKPGKLDLNSDFFNVRSKSTVEPASHSAVTRLSDSESDKEPKLQSEHESQLNHLHPTERSEANSHEYLSNHAFNQLQSYTAKIEEARKQVEIYKAKKRAQEHPIDIAKLLNAGENKQSTENLAIAPEDLHSSDFESCDSEQEDWEEVKNKSQKETSLVPAKGLQIVIEMPGAIKKKKGVDLVAAMKRRLNRIRKENQILIHKVHLLCWIAHGNYVNSVINESDIMAMALSLLPSKNAYPSDRPDLNYLEQITAWYTKTVQIATNKRSAEKSPSLMDSLKEQIKKREVYNKKMLAFLFVAILRAMGIQARIVMSLQVEPLRPPASELHSLSTKEDAKTKPKKQKETDVKAGPSGVTPKVEITIQKATPIKQAPGQSEPKKAKPRARSAGNPAANSANQDKEQLAPPKTRRRTRSTGTTVTIQKATPVRPAPGKSGLKKSRASPSLAKAKSAGNFDSNSAGQDNEKLAAPKSRRRTKSTDTEAATGTERSKSLRSTAKKEASNDNISTLKPDKRKRNRSAESVSSTASKKGTRKRPKSLTPIEIKTEEPVKKSPRIMKSKGEATTLKAPNARKRTNSGDSNKGRPKKVPQLDGNADTDSDTSLKKSKPNLRRLKKTDTRKPANKKPNLKALNGKRPTSESNNNESDSESEFEPAGGSPFKQRLQRAAPALDKLKNINKPPSDVKELVTTLVKNRIAEQKQIEQSKKVKKAKTEIIPPSEDSDSDYAPEPIKKKQRDSEDDFVPKTKVKRRIPARPELENDEEKKKKIGNDVWVEVFVEAEEKWISVDVVFGRIHCVKEIAQRASSPISYLLAWDNNNNLKDVTQRYCPNFNTITRKLRIDSKWWTESLKPFMAIPTARDKEEDDDLVRQQMDQPLPKSIAEYKNHPLYALKRHLLKFEAIYPPQAPTLGFIRGEAVYPRGCVYVLHSREIWLKQAKVVKMGEEPYKIVKARPKWDKLSNQVITDQLLEIFGPWQVQDYDPPTAENGIVPRNAFGNVDLFKPCMLPKGCVHLKLPGLEKIARRMKIDCAAAIVGFDFHSGWSHPIYDGFVACKEYEDQLICAWELEQDELERKEQEKIDKRVYGNWKRLIRGLLIRERLKAKYNFGEPSAESEKGKKKAKAPTFVIRKK